MNENSKEIEWYFGKKLSIPKHWNVLPLGKLCKVRKDGNIDSNLYVGLEQIEKRSNRLIYRDSAEEFISNKNIFCKGDILYGKLRPLLNKVWLSDEDGYCSTDILPLIPNKELVIPSILLWILSGYGFLSYATSTSAGTKMPRTKWQDMKKFKVPLIPLDDQIEIFNIINKINNEINHVEIQIQKTKLLRKNLINSIFSKGISEESLQTVQFIPKHIIASFPESWNYCLLEKLFTEKPLNGITKNVEEYGNGFPIFEIDSLYESEIFINQKNLRELSLEQRELSHYKLESDDVLINRVSKVKEGAGKIAIVRNPISNLVFEGNIIRLRLNKKKILPLFFEYFSESSLYTHYILSVCKTSNQTSIDQDIISKIPVTFPIIDIQEQIIDKISFWDKKLLQNLKLKNIFVPLRNGLIQKLLIGKVSVKV